jgi:general secretion pathway protein D
LAILNDGQFRWIIRELEQRTGVDLLCAPRVTTLSSRQTQIKVVDAKSFPTESNGTTNPPTERVELGPVIDAVPYVLPDQVTVALSVSASVKEFLGYSLAAGQQTPLPDFRQRSAKGIANVYDGQTLVLDAGVIGFQQVIKDKVPIIADVPFVGNLFQTEKKQQKQREQKRLLFFITPTIIDPAGNRIHNEDREDTPPQPTP